MIFWCFVVYAFHIFIAASGLRDTIDVTFERILQPAATFPTNEMEALFDFYVANGGEYWTCCEGKNATAWNFTDPTANPCTDLWQGIACVVPPPYNEYHVSEMQLNFRNFSSGSLPSSIQNLSYLQNLNIADNQITGTLPSALGSLTQLTSLSLVGNNYSGPIPHYFHNFSHMVSFKTSFNRLSGTVSTAICEMRMLAQLHMNANSFSGSIPSCLFSLSKVVGFTMAGNELTGTLPDNFHQMKSIVDFHLDFNQLTGTIPDVYWNMSTLSYIHMSYNALTGELPASIASLPHVFDLYMDYNYLTGTIPTSYGNLTKCILLYVNGNLLSGTIPWSFGALSNVQYLYMDNNLLTGYIPHSMGNCSKLLDLEISYNILSGTLDNIFNTINQTQITAVQLNNNQLTGTIPNELFDLMALETFVAGVNCFHGALPSKLCTRVTLKSLVLDGLSSASSCRRNLFPLISSSYVLKQSVGGSLPGCIFSLPFLTTLHLSGNGFQGTLPADVQMSPTFNDLTLSHNILDGDIRDYIQEKEWHNLDLSYNRFSGILNSNFGEEKISARVFIAKKNETELSLENNRISGVIPESVRTLGSVSILGSNIFSCDVDGNDLPKNDDDSNNYQCGSIQFNIPYYVWIGLTVALIVPLLVIWRWRKVVVYMGLGTVLQNMLKWHSVCDAKGVNNEVGTTFANVGHVFDSIIKMTAYCTLYIVVILLPFYAIVTHYNGTYTFQYAYTASAALLTGYTTFDLEFPLWIFLLFMFLVSCTQSVSKQKENLSLVTSMYKQEPLVISSVQKCCIYAIYTAVNTLIVGGVNVGFVYVVINGTKLEVISSQILLSIFKLVWNRSAVFYVLHWAGYLVTPAVAKLRNFENKFITFQIRIAVLNNIVIPCIAVFAISPSCFYNIFVAPPEVSSEYATDVCVILLSDNCLLSLPLRQHSTTYSPPFAYSYQCSSSLITSYAPSFVALCIISSFIVPVIKLSILHLHKRAVIGTKWFGFLDLILPRILRPLPAEHVGKVEVADSNKTYFNANRLFISLSTNLALILTFGVVFPPLAVSLAVNVAIIIYSARLELGRFVVNAMEQQRVGYAEVVEKECQRVGSVAVLQSIMWTLITISCLFYAIFLFDTLGDLDGFNKSYWVLIVVPLMPLWLYCAFRLFLFATVGATESTKLIKRSSLFRGSMSFGSAMEMHGRKGAPFIAEELELPAEVIRNSNVSNDDIRSTVGSVAMYMDHDHYDDDRMTLDKDLSAGDDQVTHNVMLEEHFQHY